jgi:hypothetical protein
MGIFGHSDGPGHCGLVCSLILTAAVRCQNSVRIARDRGERPIRKDSVRQKNEGKKGMKTRKNEDKDEKI